MKKNDAMPGKYLGQDDFPLPCTAIINEVILEQIKDMDTEMNKTKAVLYLIGPSLEGVDISRGIILNNTNWDSLEEITGKDDSDDWIGTHIEVYVDPNIRFGGKKVGGVRIRKASSQPDTATEATPKDEVPF